MYILLSPPGTLSSLHGLHFFCRPFNTFLGGSSLATLLPSLFKSEGSVSLCCDLSA
jgi:hypothetical protein